MKGKSMFVQWNNDVCKEYFGIVSKKIEGKCELREKGFLFMIWTIFEIWWAVLISRPELSILL